MFDPQRSRDGQHGVAPHHPHGVPPSGVATAAPAASHFLPHISSPAFSLTSESSPASSPDIANFAALNYGQPFSVGGRQLQQPPAPPGTVDLRYQAAPPPPRAAADTGANGNAESSASGAARDAAAKATVAMDGSAGSSGGGPVRTVDGEPKRSSRLGVKRRQKYTRSRTGCLGCRARRIKCDEGRPVCRRCQVAKRPCNFPDPEDVPVGKGKSKSQHSSDEEGAGVGDGDGDGDNVPECVAFISCSDIAPIGADGSSADLSGFTFDGHDPFDLSQWEGGELGASSLAAGVGTSAAGGAAAAAGSAAAAAAAPFNFVDPVGSAGLDLLGQASHEQAEVVGKTEQWTAQGGAPILSTPNFLLPWFPTPQERSLILHYCANAADLMMAIPSGLNPMLAINLPLALDSPRGANPAADALRLTLLGIGAIHQAFLLARSGTSSTAATAAMFQYAATLRNSGKEMVRRAMSAEGRGVFSDAALGASTALATIDIFFGGGGWQENFARAKSMVAYRGGPAEMLKKSTPKQITDGVTVSPARLLLEILTIYETFGCLTTGQEPTFISDRWEPWWFEKSSSTYDDHSVEKQFGMSRVMVHLFSRTARLLSRVARSGRVLTESDPVPSLPSGPSTASALALSLGGPLDATLAAGAAPPSSSSNAAGAYDPHLLTTNLGDPSGGPLVHVDSSADALVHVDSGTTGLLPASVMPKIHVGANGADPLADEARELMRDVDAWIESLNVPTLEHERVQVGNRAYAHAMRVLLLRMVYRRPREDARVQAAAHEVLQYCSISTAAMGMSIDLMWPAVIAGCCIDGASRQWLLTLLEGFKTQCCFDVDTASRIVQEAWRRADAGEIGADWKPVCDDFGLQVL